MLPGGLFVVGTKARHMSGFGSNDE